MDLEHGAVNNVDNNPEGADVNGEGVLTPDQNPGANVNSRGVCTILALRLPKYTQALKRYIIVPINERIITPTREYLSEPLHPNPGLWNITTGAAKVCIAGNLAKGLAHRFIGSKKEVPMLLLIGEIASMGALMACVSSVILWRNYTRAVDLQAKCGCSLAVAAAAIMASLPLSGMYAWIPPLLALGYTAPRIWKG